MNWFYSLHGQQCGPVSDPQLDDLLRSGKINATTLVWREGMTDWQPLSQARLAAPQLTGDGASGGFCVECGKAFPEDELVYVNRSWVCAKCKPILLQRLVEGAALPSGGGLWRMGKRLVTISETPFPDRCVKCNSPADGFRLKRVLYWQHPAYYLFLLCNLLILLIVILIVRKKAILHVGLCEKHRAKRKRGLIIGWSSLAAGAGLLICGAGLSSGWAALVGGLVLLVGGITGAAMATIITPTKITKEHVWDFRRSPGFSRRTA
jgi:hypothetical protein